MYKIGQLVRVARKGIGRVTETGTTPQDETPNSGTINIYYVRFENGSRELLRVAELVKE